MQLHNSPSQAASISHAAAKAKEKLRINSLKLLNFDSRDEQLIHESYRQVLAFTDGLQLSYGLTAADILSALQAEHKAADEYYTVRHALAWNTDFVIPEEDIVADSKLFQQCGYDFATMCSYKQTLLANNRLSRERITSIFGPTGTKIPGVLPQDFNTLLEFAEYGIAPIVAPSFQPESVNVAPLRDRYIKLHHTINKLLHKHHDFLTSR